GPAIWNASYAKAILCKLLQSLVMLNRTDALTSRMIFSTCDHILHAINRYLTQGAIRLLNIYVHTARIGLLRQKAYRIGAFSVHASKIKLSSIIEGEMRARNNILAK